MDNLDLHAFNSNTNNNTQNSTTMVTTQNDNKLHILLEDVKTAMEGVMNHVHPTPKQAVYTHEEVLAILDHAREDFNDHVSIESVSGYTTYFFDDCSDVGGLEVELRGEIEVDLSECSHHNMDVKVDLPVDDNEEWIKDALEMREAKLISEAKAKEQAIEDIANSTKAYPQEDVKTDEA
jgi:hypothetical protein